ncbi:MAG: 2Fe-2S iron-sulfur cluster binding domain-containing protein [Spirochaetes bacterium]|nr:2Fe-2S iron-sulfur cluster binding domain-containing protein [Spirochaetota bacterium]
MSEKIVVKSKLGDLLAFVGLIRLRRKKIKSASPERPKEEFLNTVVREMHPDRMFLKISEIVQETNSTRTFVLVPDAGRGTEKLATFRAGQYLNLRIDIDGTEVSRNYSLSSTPAEAAAGTYRITVRLKEGGFVTPRIFENWKTGTTLESSGPVGNFVYEGLRDKRHVIAVVGGCGITPIYSMVRDSLDRKDGVSFTVIYGVRNSDDIIFADSLEELSRNGVAIHYVASEPDENWKGPKGFITAGLIRELSGGVEDRSIFLCGPQAMYRFLDGEIGKLNLPRRLVRRELFGEADDPAGLDGFPAGNASRTYTLKVHMADEVLEVPASGGETVLVSLERAGLAPPSRCRSGECGWCRSKLISGDVFVRKENDGRRIADRKFGWFHPCSTYPVSDLEMRLPRAR